MGRNEHNLKRQKAVRRHLRNKSTPAERALWQLVRRRQIDGMKFRRQYGVGHYVLDFFCPKLRLAIELDGAGHANPLQRDSDAERTRYLADRKIRVLRFHNKKVFEQPDVVVEAIRFVIAEVQSSKNDELLPTPPNLP